MKLFDTITQSDLNNTIDLLLNNYHRELSLNIDNSDNDYCDLEFNLGEGVDAGEEIIFNAGDELRITVSNKKLALMGYTLRLFYHQLDKGDYAQNKDYGNLKSFEVKFNNDTIVVPFENNQVYLQKNFELVLIKDVGYKLSLSTSSSALMYGDDVILTAHYTLGSVPVEDTTIDFYNGETLVGTGVTNSDGLAVLTLSNLSFGSYNFSCVCDGVYSNTVPVTISTNNTMELEVIGSSFSTHGTPFDYNGRVFIDWGDYSGLVEYVGGKISHSYSSPTTHTIRIYGNITRFRNSCFQNCTGLTSINIPDSVTSIGIDCFNNCTNLTSLELPDSITNLDSFCFRGFTGLTSIKLPESITSIVYGCFQYCENLTSITIPSSVTSLEGSCFSRCTNLSSIEIPISVTSIGDSCFYLCTNLKSIELPSSVTNMGTYCFKDCVELDSVILNWDTYAKIITYRRDRFENTDSSLKFCIPQDTTSFYTRGQYPSDKLVERSS